MASTFGNWYAKWYGNWFGSVASGSVTITAAASVLSLVAPTAVASSGVTTTTSATVVTISAPDAGVNSPAIVAAAATTLQITAVASTVTGGASHAAEHTFVLCAAPTITVGLGSTITAVPAVVALFAPTAVITGGASYTDVIKPATLVVPAALVAGTVVIPTDIITAQLYTPDTLVAGYADVIADPTDIVLNPVAVYVPDGSTVYIQVEPMSVNIYTPEIAAFGKELLKDTELLAGMRDDMASIDGTQTVKLVRKTDNVVVDLVRGQAVPQNKIYTFENCLVRQLSQRDNRAVKQLRLFMQSVQNDDFTSIDTIIELPFRADVSVELTDIIELVDTGVRYTIIAIDNCTLKTRWRIGARRLT